MAESKNPEQVDETAEAAGFIGRMDEIDRGISGDMDHVEGGDGTNSRFESLDDGIQNTSGRTGTSGRSMTGAVGNVGSDETTGNRLDAADVEGESEIEGFPTDDAGMEGNRE